MDGREIPETETPLGRALWRRERIEGEQLKIIGNDNQTRVVAISATPLVGEDGKQQGQSQFSATSQRASNNTTNLCPRMIACASTTV
jgi:hypothetical protein